MELVKSLQVALNSKEDLFFEANKSFEGSLGVHMSLLPGRGEEAEVKSSHTDL